MGFAPRCAKCKTYGPDIHLVDGRELLCGRCDVGQGNVFPESLADPRIRPAFSPSQPPQHSPPQPQSQPPSSIQSPSIGSNLVPPSAHGIPLPSSFGFFQPHPPLLPSPVQVRGVVASQAPTAMRVVESTEDHFVLDSLFPRDENATTEFKACRPQNFDWQWAVGMLGKYICAILNTEGGTIYYGIRDDHIVRGLRLDAKQRDWLRLGIDHCCNRFQPEVVSSLISVSFSPVYSESNLPISDLYVALIRVRKGLPGVIYFTPYPESAAYVKREASVRELKAQSLVSFIAHRLSSPNQQDPPQPESPRVARPQQGAAENRETGWYYFDGETGTWLQYPQEVQAILESRQRREEVVELRFRGFRTKFVMEWLIEVSEMSRIEAKRLDMRPSTTPRWVSALDSQLYTFDQESTLALERALEAGRSEVEIAMNDFTVLANLDKMRITGDLPLLRFSQ